MLKSGRPRHEQISSWLRDQISAGILVADDQLPSESQLGRRFSVSRITVRRALHTLEGEGLIYRRQGLGSFVRRQPVRQGLVHLNDFVEDMSKAGLSPSSTVLHQGIEKATARIAAALEIESGKPVSRLDRLRMGDGEPIAFDRTWLPVAFGHLLEGHDLGEETIYYVLEHDFDIPVVGGSYRIEAVNATQEIAEHLSVPRGRALLLISRISRTTGRKPVYFQRRYYRSDLVAYELELARDHHHHAGSPTQGPLPLREFEQVFKKRKGG